MKDTIIAGIDVGTSKIATIIASVRDEGQIHIIGVSTVESKGLRKGQVVDIEDAKAAISISLEAAERMAGCSVEEAFITVGGSHIASQNSHGIVAVSSPEKEIDADDVRRVVEAAKAINLSSTRQILHVLPRGFVVDGQEGIADPVGMTGVRLEVDTHIVTGGLTAVKNLEKCVSELGVTVSGLVFSGFSAASAVLTDTEKELGVVLVDLGGGTIDIALFVEGALSYSSVIPIGARNITNDLAIGLRISLESAEKIKLLLSQPSKSATYPADVHKNKKMEDDDLDLSSLGLPEDLKKVSRKTLVEGIIKPRLNEIFTMVGLEIKKSGFGGMTPSGLVLCGGGAKTVGIVESSRRMLAMPVRVGIPANVTGLVDEILVPNHAASVGLIHYGVTMISDQVTTKFNFKKFGKFAGNKHGFVTKLIESLKSFLP